MPVQPLSENPSLENLRKQAKRLQKAARSGEADALVRVREFYPRADAALTAFSLADAQLVIARTFGFPSWPKLKTHLEAVERFWWDPLAPPAAGSGSPADELIRRACLTYGDWHPTWLARARELLLEQPHLTRAGLAAAATSGDVEAVRAFLDRDASLVAHRSGPLGWEPLLYACYSRLDDPAAGRSTLAVAELLLERGADPNAGFLWRGNVPPFTALTGAFGEGEGGASQPPHPRRDDLARRLLEAGADPNDGQVLYNRHFRPSDDHLKLLFAFGLGKDRGGPWYERFGEKLQSPSRLLVEELWSAARRGFRDRVLLLLEHGADPNAPGLRDGRTPHEAAVFAGNREIAELLVRHGARATALDRDAAFAAACVAGQREEALARLKEDPRLIERLGPHGRIRLVHRAVEANRVEGVRLMAELGFVLSGTTTHDGVGATLEATPLHNAAWAGSLEMVKLLVALGADPNVREGRYNATPLGWAEYNGQAEVAEYLATVTAEHG